MKDLYNHIKTEPKVIYKKWILPPFRGMTIPPFGIFIHTSHKDNPKILEHDLIHWKQYARMGLFLFYFRYFIQLLIIGYDTMPMEMEARQNESEQDKWNYREKFHQQHANSKQHGKIHN
jgi:hypothetical protein